MSVKIGQRGTTPNWMDIEWTAENRLHTARTIYAFSSRDWTRYPAATAHAVDAEQAALYCLICCETKTEAQNFWWSVCDEAAEAH
ncbi:hypothetical protein R50073_24260 [Maricurvus nonylphenolicus]|uniref:hypothetical protein n=1 Tax=Maricurvus nonylphenolicus TaxID=1008307 RepID=UPI0036F30F47